MGGSHELESAFVVRFRAPLQERRAVTLENAIRHWTIDSARALKMEEDVGSLEVGKYGDFAMFNTSPLKLDSWWFLLTHDLELGALDDLVDLTVVGGRVVHRRKKARF